MMRWLYAFCELLGLAVDVLTGGPHLYAVWRGWFEVVVWHRHFPGLIQGMINARDWKGFPPHTLQIGAPETEGFLRCFWRTTYRLNYKPETWDATVLDLASPGLEATTFIVFEPVDFAEALSFSWAGKRGER